MKKLNFKNLMGGKMLLLAPIAIMILGVLILLFSYVSEKDVKIVSMKVTNVSENSATVTWLSKTKDKGVVVVSEKNDFGVLTSFSKAHYYDERDQVSGTITDRYTHQVKVTGLNPETKYYFRVTEGLKLTEYAYPALETAPTLNALVTPDPSYGSIKTGDLGDDVLIYSRFKGSTLGSSVVEANGSFSLDKTNYRTQTLDGRETYKDGDIIVFEVLTNEGVANYVVKIGEDKPFGLGELKDSLIKQTSLNKGLVSGVNAKEANEDGGGTYTPPPSYVPTPTPGAVETPVPTPDPVPACVPSCSNIQCGNTNSCGTGYCTSDCKSPEKPKTVEANPLENVSCDDLKTECKGADSDSCAEYQRRSCRTSEAKLKAGATETDYESSKTANVKTALEKCGDISVKNNRYEREECLEDAKKEGRKNETILANVKKYYSGSCLNASQDAAYYLSKEFPGEPNLGTAAYYACCKELDKDSCRVNKPATLKELCGISGLEPKESGTTDYFLNRGDVPVYQDASSLCKTNSLEDCQRINPKLSIYINGSCYSEEQKKSEEYLKATLGETDKFCDAYYGLGEGKFTYKPSTYGKGIGICVPKTTSPEICGMTFPDKPNYGTDGDEKVQSDKTSIAASIYIGVTADGKCIKYNDDNGKLLLKKYGGVVTNAYCEEVNRKGYIANPDRYNALLGGGDCINTSVENCRQGFDYVAVSSKGVCIKFEEIGKNLYSDADCQERYNSKDFRLDKEKNTCVPTKVEACSNSALRRTVPSSPGAKYVKIVDGKCISDYEEAMSNMEKNKKATQEDCDALYSSLKPGNFKPKDVTNYSTNQYCTPVTVSACERLKIEGRLGLKADDKIVGVKPDGSCIVKISDVRELPIILDSYVIKKGDADQPVGCNPNTYDSATVCKEAINGCVTSKLDNGLVGKVNAANELGGGCKVYYYESTVKCAKADVYGMRGLCVGSTRPPDNEDILRPSMPNKSSSSSTSSEGALNGNPIKSVNAVALVLGASDGQDTSVKVDEKGTYKVSLTDSKVTLLSDKFTFTESSDGTYSGKFYLDTNFNGVKDANEEYYKDDLSLKVEKVGDLETYNLVAGWNLIGWNFAKSDVLTAKDFLVRVARSGGYATHMATYRNGEWKELSLRGDSEFGTNFSLLPTEGYFVKVITPANVVVEGTKISKNDQVSVINGWNLMSFRPTKVTLASSMLDSVNSSSNYTLDTVTRYDSGRYENLVKDSTTTYGKDFNLEENKGYFIRALNKALVKKN